jgi:chorismate mutase
LSDASQQITPLELKAMLNNLVLRKANVDNAVVAHTLEDLRRQIDKYDDRLIDVLDSRMKVADKIGKYKKDNNITILQSSRWDQLLTKRVQDGEKKGLSEDFVVKLFRAIHQESINHQTKIMNE